jgi:hypothetical protein
MYIEGSLCGRDGSVGSFLGAGEMRWGGADFITCCNGDNWISSRQRYIAQIMPFFLKIDKACL